MEAKENALVESNQLEQFSSRISSFIKTFELYNFKENTLGFQYIRLCMQLLLATCHNNCTLDHNLINITLVEIESALVRTLKAETVTRKILNRLKRALEKFNIRLYKETNRVINEVGIQCSSLESFFGTLLEEQSLLDVWKKCFGFQSFFVPVQIFVKALGSYSV
eukprot:TRINITY_DN15884_c0_g1_i1.p1 TRINITY_DN15884_c0_g1~~TRINITY_DN15884_c0_g1_i1.p1  ORF type:complete len:165 (+),score=12.45 TRINITY_DN15884_c0_g1_i1:91-585(+)